MATYAENLVTARNEMAERLAEITANPQPSYTDQGRTVSWTEYQSMLIDKLAVLEGLIQRANGPILVRSRGRGLS